MKSVTLLGSFSGRNAGDTAILASIMQELSAAAPGVLFEVPTTHPGFIREQYGDKYNVRPISIMPWTGSIRLLGIPTYRSMLRTDLSLITDGIIFDVRLLNPAFNFLTPLYFLVPAAKRAGKKIVCYNVGIGPLRSKLGRRFAKKVGDDCDGIYVRDDDSLKLFREIGVDKEIVVSADSAFAAKAVDEDRTDRLLTELGIDADKPLLGFNVTSYVDKWLKAKGEIDPDRFKDRLASALDETIDGSGAQLVFVITQVMDIGFAEEIRSRMKNKSWLVNNRDLSVHEIMGVMGRTDLFAGMRLHSLILASSVGAPVFGMAYAPKVRSLFSLFGEEDSVMDLSDITEGRLAERILSAWKGRKNLKSRLEPVINEQKQKARDTAGEVARRYLS